MGSEGATPVLATNPVDQTASLPPYLIPAISMAEYAAKAKPPLSFEAEPPLLKILDFGGGMLVFSFYYAVTNLIFPPAFKQGEARLRIQSTVGVCPPEVIFPMIALDEKDPNWDMRSDIWSLACTVSPPPFFFVLVVECILT